MHMITPVNKLATAKIQFPEDVAPERRAKIMHIGKTIIMYETVRPKHLKKNCT